MIGYDWRPLLYGKYTLGGSAPIQSIQFCKIDMHCGFLVERTTNWKPKSKLVTLTAWAANGWCSSFDDGTRCMGGSNEAELRRCAAAYDRGNEGPPIEYRYEIRHYFRLTDKFSFSPFISFFSLFGFLLVGLWHLPGPLWQAYCHCFPLDLCALTERTILIRLARLCPNLHQKPLHSGYRISPHLIYCEALLIHNLQNSCPFLSAVDELARRYIVFALLSSLQTTMIIM